MSNELVGAAKHLISLLRKHFCESGVPPRPPFWEFPETLGIVQQFETSGIEGIDLPSSNIFSITETSIEHCTFASLLTCSSEMENVLEEVKPLKSLVATLRDVSSAISPNAAPRFNYLFKKLCQMQWFEMVSFGVEVVQPGVPSNEKLGYQLKVVDSDFLDDMESSLEEISIVTISFELTEKESDICEALGNDVKTGEELAKLAGYPSGSAFRQTLSNLVKRGILVKQNPKGYSRCPDTP